jgi:pimeloyl-ACP methyl ester carboxylesterase
LGNGKNPVVCFHGYGEDADSFGFLEKYADEEFTFIAIDLPFHGGTKWNEGLNFSVQDLQLITEAILNMDQERQERVNKFSLMGFSLGGRIALGLFEKMPQNIDRLVLLAPDGLKLNFWYWLATQTWAGNQLFALTMKKPGWFFGFLKGMNKLGLVNTSIFKFVSFYIGDKEVRRLLYERWICLRNIRPNLGKIRSFIRTGKTPIRLVYGKHDRIILPKRGELFIHGLEEYCTLSVIHSGHQVLHEKHVQEILPALLH